jgi:hypothetical protein
VVLQNCGALQAQAVRLWALPGEGTHAKAGWAEKLRQTSLRQTELLRGAITWRLADGRDWI